MTSGGAKDGGGVKHDRHSGGRGHPINLNISTGNFLGIFEVNALRSGRCLRSGSGDKTPACRPQLRLTKGHFCLFCSCFLSFLWPSLKFFLSPSQLEVRGTRNLIFHPPLFKELLLWAKFGGTEQWRMEMRGYWRTGRCDMENTTTL